MTRRARALPTTAVLGLAAALLAGCSAAAAPPPGDAATGAKATPRATTKAPKPAPATSAGGYGPAPSSGGSGSSTFDTSIYPDPVRDLLPLYEPPAEGKTIYLTFDDGPDRTWTPQVLAALAEHDAKATFFVLGKQIRVYPDLLEAENAAGHSVQSHSNNHPDLRKLDDKLVAFQQLRPVTKLIRAHAHQNPTCLRPPYGAYDDRVRAIAGGQKLRLVMWTDDSLDWERPGVDAIVSRVMANARPGAVVLFHDAGGERSQTVAALKVVLARLAAQGYTFGTLCRD